MLSDPITNDLTSNLLSTNDPLNQNTLKRIAFLDCHSQGHVYHWRIVILCGIILVSSFIFSSKSMNEAQANLNLPPIDNLRIASLINHQLDQPFPSKFPFSDQPISLPATQQSAFEQSASILLAPYNLNSYLKTDTTSTLASAPKTQQITVQEGDNLAKIFKRLNLSSSTLHAISQASPNTELLFNIKSGDQLDFDIAPNQKLVRLIIPKNMSESIEFSLQNEIYHSNRIKKVVETNQRFAEGVIENSFYLAAQKAGLSDEIIMELVETFAWDIDFSEDIHPGDHFSVLYEQKNIQGKPLSAQILAARFTTQNGITTAIAFTDSNGETRFYTPQGLGMKKPFKRNPVDFARISSYFNSKRFHPILHTMRAHKGVDYAAKTGTPIKATGDGKILFSGRKGGYGNTIIIQHGQNITTLYGHLHKFSPNLKVGDRVKQDQVIGQVGSSGLATGPHLHYEFLVDGENKNPLTVALTVSEPIKTQYQLTFKQRAREFLVALDHRMPVAQTYARLENSSNTVSN